MITIVAFLIAIALLILVHEFGHFLLARLLGIKVLKFSLGFGRSLWSFRDRKGTEFVLAWLPIGGYVKLLDEREGLVAQSELPFAFNRQPVWKRLLVVCAGPFFNLLLAFVMYWIILTTGYVTLAPIVGKVHSHSIASVSGLKTGDEFISINQRSIFNWKEVELAYLFNSDRFPITTVVKRNNHLKTLLLSGHPPKTKMSDVFDSLGIEPYIPPIPPIVDTIVNDGPASKSGLMKGDKILRVAKHPVNEWADFVGYIKLHPNQTIKIQVQRNHSKVALTLHSSSQKTSSGVQGYVGVIAKSFNWPEKLVRKQHYPFWLAWKPALSETWSGILLTGKMVGKILSGQVSLHSISGPIGIAQGAGQSASFGLLSYLNFLAMISIGLGILNILPIPALDGGYVLYYLIELVMRKPVPEHVQEIGFSIGVGLLLLLMIVAFYNDVGRLLM